jgi:hypothetical protein
MNQLELRLGNWINSYHGNVRVVSLGQELVTTPNKIGVTHGAIYSGIDLNYDILKKCGFRPLNSLYFVRDNYSMWEFRCFAIKFRSNDGESFTPIKAKCQYLHQLQNVYFFITGEEIQVEL